MIYDTVYCLRHRELKSVIVPGCVRFVWVRLVIFVIGVCILGFGPTGCGCPPIEQPLPAPNDPKYAEIERLIERTAHPYVVLRAKYTKQSAREFRDFLFLGYLYKSRGYYYPTKVGRQHASFLNWASDFHEPFEKEANNFIQFTIGTYSVTKLTRAAAYTNELCTGFGSQHDEYGFTGVVKLDALGRRLLQDHLLYVKTRSKKVTLWNGRTPVNDLWSNPGNGDPDYRFVKTSPYRAVDFKAVLLEGDDFEQ